MTRVIFMGSPEFAVPVLRALSADCNVVGVVTQPDRPAGRGREFKPPPVKRLAIDLGLPVFQPEKLRAPEAMEQLRSWMPELIVVAAFGQILRPDVLSLPPQGCVNVHGSLLPRWRGAAPVQAALLAGDPETGITIMKMDQGVDTGGIISQEAIPIDPEDTAGSLLKKLSHLGAELLMETLRPYLSGELHSQAQNEADATSAPMLKKDNGRLDFTRPADELARQVRAFNPWPGAFLEWNGQPLKVHRAHPDAGNASMQQRLVYEGRPAVGAAVGLLILDEVQSSGKKAMSGEAFLMGARTWTS